MRLIDADALMQNIPNEEMLAKMAVAHAPSIDIVCCKECKWSKANGTYQWCGRLDSTARITADDFCSYGSRSEKPNNSKVSEKLTGSERSSE